MKKFGFIIVFFSTLISLQAQELEVTKIILIRHAEKADDGTPDPSLSDTGKLRAERFASFLSYESVDRLFSTPYRRTQETLEPLSRNKECPIELYTPGKPVETAAQLLAKQGKTLVVAGHSNTIPALVNALVGEARFTDMQEQEYNKIWILLFNKDQLIECSIYTY